MKPGQKLTLPGAVLLLLALLLLNYLQKGEPSGGRDVGASSSGRAVEDVRDRNQERGRGGEGQANGGNARGTAKFDYYALVMSWSPTHCAEPEAASDEMQCARRDGRRYAFVLHGLWPQYQRGYPESCPMSGRVPENVIDGMVDIMPSRGLIVHEYRKHGTCAGLDAQAYYALARKLYTRIKVPQRFQNPSEAQFLRPDDLVDAFVAQNPGVRPENMAVVCGGAGGRFRELRICFSPAGELRACGDNEDQGRLCRTQRLHVPPVRSTSRG